MTLKYKISILLLIIHSHITTSHRSYQPLQAICAQPKPKGHNYRYLKLIEECIQEDRQEQVALQQKRITFTQESQQKLAEFKTLITQIKTSILATQNAVRQKEPSDLPERLTKLIKDQQQLAVLEKTMQQNKLLSKKHHSLQPLDESLVSARKLQKHTAKQLANLETDILFLMGI